MYRVFGGSVLGSHVGAHIHALHASLRGRLHNPLRDSIHRRDIRLSHRHRLPLGRGTQDLQRNIRLITLILVS